MNTKEPPLHLLSQQEIFAKLWTDEKSIRAQLEKIVNALEFEIQENSEQYQILTQIHDLINIMIIVSEPTESVYKNLNSAIQKKFTTLSALFKCVHSTSINTKSLSEILYMHSKTKTYFTLCNSYERVISKEVEVRLCDVTGEKKIQTELMAEAQGSTVYKGVKEYDSSFILAQLSGWFKHTVNRSNASLSTEKRGTLTYPDLESFIVKPAPKPIIGTERQIIKLSMGMWKPPTSTEEETDQKKYEYPTGERTEFYKKVAEVPSFIWPLGNSWSYKNKAKFYGSIQFDSIKEADETGSSDKWKYLREIINNIIAEKNDE